MTRELVYTVPQTDRPPIPASFEPRPAPPPKVRRVAVPFEVRQAKALRKPGTHGTVAGYSDWRCRCDKCKAAWAARWRETRRDRFTREIPETTRHGSEHAYNHYGCRCEPCKQAHNAGVYERRKNRKKAA